MHVSQWIKGVFADQQIVEIEEAKDSPNSKIVSFFPINAAAGAGPSLKLEVICEKIGQNSSNDPQTLTILAQFSVASQIIRLGGSYLSFMETFRTLKLNLDKT